MAGHSHSANIKYRKDRQDSARSKLFLKLGRKLESIIREEREVNEKSLSIARENKFPKEKVYQIWEKIKKEKNNAYSSRALFQANFGILIFLQDSKNITDDLIKELHLKKISLSLIPNYFQLFYSLKVGLKTINENLEEYLITYLPSEVWEKTTYDEEKRKIISLAREEIEKIKNIIKESELELVIEEEKSFWKPLIPIQLIKEEEIQYYQWLEKQLVDSMFYTNIEK